MSKLSISIDMGAKNNGIFIIKTNGNNIENKKAVNIIVDNINFSKKSRRENRHKDRNYKRRKLAKRLLKEFIPFSNYNYKEQELMLGILNNRGYTFISSSTDFDNLNDDTIDFINVYFKDLIGLAKKEDFEEKISSFEELDKLEEFINNVNSKIEIEIKKKKEEFYKEYQFSFTIIKKDLQEIKKLFESLQKELNTGSKPRTKYLDEIKQEIKKDFNFIKEYSNEEFFNLIGTISNLQLRVLRKYFNQKFNEKLDKQRLDLKLRKYFKAFHYKSEKEKNQKKELFKILDNEKDIVNFLKTTNPKLTIPPYEDMNNRNTYKCNSMLINPNLITDDLKQTIDFLLSKEGFSKLLISSNSNVFEKEEQILSKVIKDNQKIKKDFTYSKYLQRILDSTSDITSKELNPRNVFKHKAKFENGQIDCIDSFKRVFGEKTYDSLKRIAQQYYQEEEKIINGIYEESNSIFIKCNINTPYKNNAKHILLKSIYSYDFKEDEAEKLLQDIKNIYGLQKALERVSSEAKKYQNSFYNILETCYNNPKYIDDKDIKNIVNNIEKNFQNLKIILKDKNTYLNTIEKVNEKNLTRIVNIFKQTYEILFKDIGGFNKTCKKCTIENSIRSDEKYVIAKRLLSDVAKPIDGMLDMMLDRLAYEINKNITFSDIKNCESLEILLEQNKFEFEENLNTIKRVNNSQIKKFDAKKYKDKLNVNICPYTGKSFDKGDWDHILPQSKGLFNSKANMIYCSVEGNQKIKGNIDYTLEMLHQKHLEEVFGKKSIEEIKLIIKEGVNSINIDSFTNFNNLKFNQQIALRYALFLRNTSEFNKAFDILKKDKIKTFSNGTQKRLARLIYEKLSKKFPNELKKKYINSKVIDNQLVSLTRKYLSVNQETGEINNQLFKNNKQNSHSHCIDAMIVFYLANSELKGQKYKEKNNISLLKPMFHFNDIYLEDSGINNLSKNKTFINSDSKELNSYSLFADTIYSEAYKHILKENIKEKDLKILTKYKLLYESQNGKKIFKEESTNLEANKTYKIDIQRVADVLYRLFIEKNEQELNSLKFLDKLHYVTSRKEIENIFFDSTSTKLLEFSEIKGIPYFSKNLYKSVYKKLQNESKLFNINENEKTTLNKKVLNRVLENMYSSKQKNKQIKKRDKKRHKFSLPILGSAKFRIKRMNTWQVLGNKDIATKNYIINGNIKPIPFFSKNTIPLKISDLIDCLLIDESTKSVYEVNIDIKDISNYVLDLKYYISEAKRCTVEVTFIKDNFKDFNFGKISLYDGAKDETFKYFISNYIDNKNLELSKYLGSIRDGIKGKAILLDINSKTITLQYKAAITNYKKQLILLNYK